MQYSQFNIKTMDDIKLNCINWHPDDISKAVVIIVHGLGEHINRYLHVAERLTKAGFTIVGFDLRGHGKSEGIRGHAPSYAALTNDIRIIIDYSNKIYPSSPIFLYGHSLGGSLLLYLLLTQRPKIKGAVVSSPGLTPIRPISPLLKFTARILSKFIPTLQLKNKLDTSGLSQDKNIVAEYINDPLVHDKISTRLGIELIDQGQWIYQNAKMINTPLLFVQGGKDRLVNPSINMKFFERLNGNATLLWRENGYHELHNEPNKEEIIDSLIAWMNNILST